LGPIEVAAMWCDVLVTVQLYETVREGDGRLGFGW
jgi:hypothetical protein